jgi:hypothetical protein
MTTWIDDKGHVHLDIIRPNGHHEDVVYPANERRRPSLRRGHHRIKRLVLRYTTHRHGPSIL